MSRKNVLLKINDQKIRVEKLLSSMETLLGINGGNKIEQLLWELYDEHFDLAIKTEFNEYECELIFQYFIDSDSGRIPTLDLRKEDGEFVKNIDELLEFLDNL